MHRSHGLSPILARSATVHVAGATFDTSNEEDDGGLPPFGRHNPSDRSSTCRSRQDGHVTARSLAAASIFWCLALSGSAGLAASSLAGPALLVLATQRLASSWVSRTQKTTRPKLSNPSGCAHAAVRRTGDCRWPIRARGPRAPRVLHARAAREVDQYIRAKRRPPMTWRDGCRQKKPLHCGDRLPGAVTAIPGPVLGADRDNFGDNRRNSGVPVNRRPSYT